MTDSVTNTTSRGIVPALLAIVTLASIGCQSGYRSDARAVTRQWDSGNYTAAATTGTAAAKTHQSDDIDRVVYNLEAGRTAQAAGDVRTSIEYYDLAYEDVRPYLDTDAEATVSEAVVTTAVNQSMATYRGTPNERILMSTMQAINYMELGDMESARIELNRAHDWQQDAEQRYAKEIEREQAKLEEEAEDESIETETDARSGLPASVAPHYAYLQDLRGYGAYRNPFPSHLRGVFLLARGADVGDLANARTDLNEVAGMSPDAMPMLEADLALADRPPNTGMPAITWVYFLPGRAPHKEELRLDIPIPVGKVNYVSAAFPRLVHNRNHHEGLEVHGPEVESVLSLEIADNDRIVASEFNERLPTIVTQEIISSAGKAAATWAMAESAGSYGQLAGIIYQAASTSADTRSWRTMPAVIEVARVPTPGDGELELVADGRGLGRVRVAPNECNILIVTLPSVDAAEASITNIQLTGERTPWTETEEEDEPAPSPAA